MQTFNLDEAQINAIYDEVYFDMEPDPNYDLTTATVVIQLRKAPNNTILKQWGEGSGLTVQSATRIRLDEQIINFATPGVYAWDCLITFPNTKPYTPFGGTLPIVDVITKV